MAALNCVSLFRRESSWVAQCVACFPLVKCPLLAESLREREQDHACGMEPWRRSTLKTCESMGGHKRVPCRGSWEPVRDLFSNLWSLMMLIVELWAAPFFPEPTSFFSCPSCFGGHFFNISSCGTFQTAGLPCFNWFISSLTPRTPGYQWTTEAAKPWERERIQWGNMSVF